MKCSKCDQELDAAAKFCPKCGNSLESELGVKQDPVDKNIEDEQDEELEESIEEEDPEVEESAEAEEQEESEETEELEDSEEPEDSEDTEEAEDSEEVEETEEPEQTEEAEETEEIEDSEDAEETEEIKESEEPEELEEPEETEELEEIEEAEESDESEDQVDLDESEGTKEVEETEENEEIEEPEEPEEPRDSEETEETEEKESEESEEQTDSEESVEDEAEADESESVEIVVTETMHCPECDEDFDVAAKFCPKCGSTLELKQIEPAQARSKPWIKRVIIAGAVIVALALVVLLMMSVPAAAESNPLADVEVGVVVNLGQVTFNDSAGNQFSEDVGWQVLAIEEGQALVISEKILDLRPYNSKEEELSAWENSEIRGWLNGDFFNGLPDFVRDNAQKTRIENTANPEFGSSGGGTTEDIVFLLSIEEALSYFQTDEERQVTIDVDDPSFARVIDAYSEESSEVESFVQKYNTWPWWVRSSGVYSGTAFVVDFDGVVYMRFSTFEAGIRPALWISTE